MYYKKGIITTLMSMAIIFTSINPACAGNMPLNTTVSESTVKEELTDTVDIQTKKKTTTYSGGIRNGMVAYADQAGKIKRVDKKITIPLGGTGTVSFTGIDADTKDVTFVSNKPNTVQVDADGNVYGIKTGSATITMWYNGKKTKTRIKVQRSKEKGTQNLIETYTGNGKKTTKIKIRGAKKKEITYSENEMIEQTVAS